MSTIVQDVRFALRTLIRRPTFTLVAGLTLALGIGGNTAVFSVVNAVLLRPLPLPHADRLVWIHGRESDGRWPQSVSAPDFAEYDAQVAAFEELAAYSSRKYSLAYTHGGRPIELTARLFTHDFLTVLGKQPVLGRTFTADETNGDRPQVAMISHGVWDRLFGLDSGVVGSTIRLDDAPLSVVGVLPENLAFPVDLDVWLPFSFGVDRYAARDVRFLHPVGLLAEGFSAADVQQAMDVVSGRLEAEYPDTNEGWYPVAEPLQSLLVGSIRPALLVLFTAIGFVLLIACANVASLMLGRSERRGGEMAVRAAMGASRGRVIRQLMTESLVLSLGAGAIGVVVARLGMLLGLRFYPGYIPRSDEVTMDISVLLFTVAISVAVGVVFGIVPAFRLASRDVATSLQVAGRGTLIGGGRLRSVLIAGEVALSVVLLTSALLLARSFTKLLTVDPGFDSNGLVAMSLSFPPAEAQYLTLDRIIERVGALPNVEEVSATSMVPLSSSSTSGVVYAEGGAPSGALSTDDTEVRWIDERYFEAMDVRLERGRGFLRTDDGSAPPRAVVSQTLANALFPLENPIGKRIVMSFYPETVLEIIGVVQGVRQFDLRTAPVDEFYLSNRQFPQRRMSLVVRGKSGVAPPVGALRAAIWDVDPSQRLWQTTTFVDDVSGSIATGRFQAVLIGLFSTLAVGLAGIGIYGVLAETVESRRREIGVRMALGAEGGVLITEVILPGMILGAVGVVVGLTASLFVTRVLSSALFGVNTRDPLTFALTPLLVMIVALLASWIPARQATKIDPATALREEC